MFSQLKKINLYKAYLYKAYFYPQSYFCTALCYIFSTNLRCQNDKFLDLQWKERSLSNSLKHIQFIKEFRIKKERKKEEKKTEVEAIIPINLQDYATMPICPKKKKTQHTLSTFHQSSNTHEIHMNSSPTNVEHFSKRSQRTKEPSQLLTEIKLTLPVATTLLCPHSI